MTAEKHPPAPAANDERSALTDLKALLLGPEQSSIDRLQREIGKCIKSRVTPKLSFIYDDTDIRGRRLSDLIDSAVASDRIKADH